MFAFRQIRFSHESSVPPDCVGMAREQEARELGLGGEVVGRRRETRSRRFVHDGRRVCGEYFAGLFRQLYLGRVLIV